MNNKYNLIIDEEKNMKKLKQLIYIIKQNDEKISDYILNDDKYIWRFLYNYSKINLKYVQSIFEHYSLT